MCSSVTVKALQSGWDVLSQIAGFFSAATDVCPVIGAELMCRALAMADSRVSSLASGPTPVQWENEIKRWVRGQDRLKDWIQAVVGDLLCNPLGRSMVRRTCSVTSDDRRPFNLFSQNSCRQTDRQLFIWSSHWFLISFACSFSRHFQCPSGLSILFRVRVRIRNSCLKCSNGNLRWTKQR